MFKAQLSIAFLVFSLLASSPLLAAYYSSSHYYTYEDSTTNSGLATGYPWIDISSTGTAVTSAGQTLGDDVVSDLINLGFSFNYAGTNYTQLKVSSNGVLEFGSTNNNNWTNTTISSATTLPTSMMPYWRDMNPSAGGSIKYKSFGSAPNRYFVVSFIGVVNFGSTNPNTFQAQIYENGTVVYRYGAMYGNGNLGTSGYRFSASDYAEYSHNAASLTNGLTIVWRPPAKLLAAYHFEETTWNGTAGELKDYSGNNLNASALSTSSPKPSYAYANPAVAGSTGTCGYANIPGPAANGGAFSIASLPVSTTTGEQNTVAFWMYWDGTNAMMPIGWGRYDLYLHSGKFGFNTSVSDIYGTTSTGLANGWHHVVATFTNGSVTSNALYIDGVNKALSQQLGTANTTYAVAQSTLQASGWTNSTAFRFSGRIDELKVYKGALNATEVAAVKAETHPCSITPTAPLAEYRMDELAWGGTSNEITDSSGNGYNGSAKNGTSTATAKICMGGSFNGSGNYAQVPDIAALRLTGNYTIAAWVKMPSTATAGTIVSKFTAGSPWPGYNFGLDLNGSKQLNLSTGSGWYTSNGSVVADNSWHHVAAQLNGTSLQFYVDGIANGSAITVNASTTQSTVPLTIGLNSDYAGSCCRFFNGQMDELKLWNSALSATQIYTLYSNESAGKNWDGSTRICPSILAEYRMEDASWNGTAGEVADSSGNNRNGTATGSTGLPSIQSAAPPRTGSPGTCTFGSFAGATNNQAINLGAIDLGIGNTGAFSVSAWVRWAVTPSSGNQYATIVGNNIPSAKDTGQFWLMHDTGNAHFEFSLTTSSGRAHLSSATAATANTWYHLVGVYNGATMALYVNGSLNNSFAKTGTIAAFAPTYVTMIGKQADTTTNRAFQGDIDEVRLYNYALSAADVSNIYNSTHACSYIVTGLSAANFNCVESGADAATGHLYTELVNSPLSFDVVALKADGTTVETYFAGTSANKNVTVELVDGSGSTDCASRTALSPAVSQTLAFASTDQGRKAVTSLTPTKAYANLRCRVTDANASPSVVACSTDNFSVRPSGFTVSSSMNADSTGTNASATPILKTGSNFTLTAASGAANYTGTPQIDLSKLAAHTGAVQTGTLDGSFSAANSGTGSASGSAFSYSEVGYFKLNPYGVYDDSFTAVDSGNGDCTADFSNALVNGKYGCKFGNTAASSFFGRFIPDHLTASVANNGSFIPTCSTFTYNGLDFNYNNSNRPSLLVTAQNSANASTQNYTGNFAKLAIGNFAVTSPTTDAMQKGVDNTNFLQLSRTPGTAALTDNGNGSLNYTFGTDIYKYNRENNALVNKFTAAINLAFTNITDADAVSTNNLPLTLSPTGIEIRYGRTSMGNANGSELLDLPIPMAEEYYDGHNFVASTDNNCDEPTLSLSDPNTSDSLTTTDTCVWDSANLSGMACPGTAPTGTSYLNGVHYSSNTYNLRLKAPGKTGSLKLTANVATWLQFNWQGAGMANPSAQASFGLYKGSPEVIYFREVY